MPTLAFLAAACLGTYLDLQHEMDRGTRGEDVQVPNRGMELEAAAGEWNEAGGIQCPSQQTALLRPRRQRNLEMFAYTGHAPSHGEKRDEMQSPHLIRHGGHLCHICYRKRRQRGQEPKAATERHEWSHAANNHDANACVIEQLEPAEPRGFAPCETIVDGRAEPHCGKTP